MQGQAMRGALDHEGISTPALSDRYSTAGHQDQRQARCTMRNMHSEAFEVMRPDRISPKKGGFTFTKDKISSI